MKVVRIPSNIHESDPQIALRLIESIGLDTFAMQMLENVEAVLPSSHCTIFGLQSNGRMEAVATASAIGEIATLTAIDYMRMGFDRQDSNTTRRARQSRQRIWINQVR